MYLFEMLVPRYAMSSQVTLKPAHRIGSEIAKIPDEELMIRLAEGQIESLGELYFRYGGMVRSAVVRAAPEIPLSKLDDLTQDIFLAVHLSVSRYNEQSKFRSWLYTIASKKAMAWRRNTWLRRKLLGLHEGEPIAIGNVERDQPDKAITMRRAANEALSMLPKKQREVLILSAVEGFSGEEIAQTMGMKVDTVRTWLHRARKKLQGSHRAKAWTAALKNG